MTSWIKLDHQLPKQLQQAAADVAKAVWFHVGNVIITDLGNWRHVAHVSYTPKPDGSLGALILNCVEGAKGSTSQSAAYTVDLMRQHVKVQGHPVRYEPLPTECLPLIGRIRDWVEKERQAQQDRLARERQAENERRRAREAGIKAYILR
ncbi:Uu.00g074500.m01.CDS01 [Anthostomella pinea]|uniref:Uu.00g074500.m01.CDS01 n=1 Tax=Anthostomella pinea TaxID=933095 RepID=A0AAI8YP36_9PEZI|nr:Uu.00g074500.m01.CDS01 [Anthostomella pinea]